MPHQGGYADVLPRPSSFISWQGPGPERQSLYGDLRYYLTQRAQEMLSEENSSIDIEKITIRIISSHYLLLVDYFDGIMNDREFPLSRKKNFSTQETLNMEEEWSTIQLIRGSLSLYTQNISWIMVQLRIPFEDPGSTNSTPNSLSSDFQQDFQYIYMQLRVLKARADLLNESLTGLTGILGNKRSIREAKTVKTLTLVALIFIPLSFTSALFSMYDDFLPGRERFWVFWVVSLPLVIAVLVLATILDFGYDDNGTWRPTIYLSIWKEK
ncbi:hypothetical protein FPHYL_3222 [Fusarium phyllophilum]|uniref:Uncharacterized protein n=1 Tax=Fusarium phyllophilum TaxID=47803 RepID=A0A8H5K4F5_9HYPO|nr:hypothetical protein FPHYL_3222 [Fusarium phyllophilum]